MVAAAHAILEDSTKWKNGKRFHKVVQTFGRPKGPTDGAAWHGRVSEHDASDATFDEFWSKLGVDHSENEKLCVCTPSRARGRTCYSLADTRRYIPTIKKVTHIKDVAPNQSIWSLNYTFPPPVSPRTFTILVTTHLNESSPKTGSVQLSFALSLSFRETDTLSQPRHLEYS